MTRLQPFSFYSTWVCEHMVQTSILTAISQNASCLWSLSLKMQCLLLLSSHFKTDSANDFMILLPVTLCCKLCKTLLTSRNIWFLFVHYFTTFKNWSVVDLQCCISSRCTAKWLRLFLIIHYYNILNIKYLYYRVGPWWLFILYIVMCIC